MSEEDIEKPWSTPEFVKNFEAARFQQTTDAHFRAVVTGKPIPEVSWTRKGQALPCSDKYEYHYEPSSGQITLQIRDLGPGDEGQYSCTVSNDYGSVTATLNVNPDVNALRHGGLSHGSSGALRASLQRKMKHQNSDLNSDCNRD